MKKYLSIFAILLLANCATHKSSDKENSYSQKLSKESQQNFSNTVNFGYDSSSLSLDTREKLATDITILKQEGFRKITVEGHCDARGTEEYNLALGEKRAYAVKRFLVRNGLSDSKIKTISYGEARPKVAKATNSAYAANRRAEIKVK